MNSIVNPAQFFPNSQNTILKAEKNKKKICNFPDHKLQRENQYLNEVQVSEFPAIFLLSSVKSK